MRSGLFLFFLVLLFAGKALFAQDSVRQTPASKTTAAQTAGARWGTSLPAKSVLQGGAQKTFRQKLEQHPQWEAAYPTWAVEQEKPFTDRTTEFYLLLLLLGILGLIRAGWPRYFHNLWRAFWQGTASSPALRSQLEDAGQPALLMNILFALTGGAYIYYLARLYTRSPVSDSPAVAIGALVAGLGMVYFFKWAAIQASGWAFGVQALTGSYLFNVFLVNKIMAIVLLPFTLLLAFGGPAWAAPAGGISVVLVAGLLLLRYIRSWPTLRAFFSNSHFHFLTYFCASEILPLAILTKLLLPFLGR